MAIKALPPPSSLMAVGPLFQKKNSASLNAICSYIEIIRIVQTILWISICASCVLLFYQYRVYLRSMMEPSTPRRGKSWNRKFLFSSEKFLFATAIEKIRKQLLQFLRLSKESFLVTVPLSPPPLFGLVAIGTFSLFFSS